MIRLAGQAVRWRCTRIRGRQFDASPIRERWHARFPQGARGSIDRAGQSGNEVVEVVRRDRTRGLEACGRTSRAGAGQAPYQRGCGAAELV